MITALDELSEQELVAVLNETKNALTRQFAGCDAVIHLVGIIREFPGRGITFEKMHVTATENILAACAEQGVQRRRVLCAVLLQQGQQVVANGIPQGDDGAEGVAEDLGVITPQVTALRFRFGIPGMRVLQFEGGLLVAQLVAQGLEEQITF